LLVLSVTFALTLAVPAAADEAPHWAFQKPRRPDPPAVRDRAWVRNPIDAFVLARLEKVGLKPSPLLDRAALLRRVTYDLTGLPPTPRELDDFLKDRRPDAYARVVERLLASPHYGERWAQHWLDVVRYAESNGYESDAERPHAWRYRDYVVRSFNEDRPYDRFLTEQLAGDLLAQAALRRGAKATDPQVAELYVAAGFNRCGPVHLTSGNVDTVAGRLEVLNEMTGAVGAAFLGLTIGCARCHDHKFDPISLADYYRLQAFFAASFPKEVDLATPAERAASDEKIGKLNAKLAPLRQQLAALDGPYRVRIQEAKKAQLEAPYREALAVEPGKRTAEQKKLAAHAQTLIQVRWDEIVGALSLVDRVKRTALREQIHALEAQRPPPPAQAWTLAEASAVPETRVLKRGDPNQKGRRVEPTLLGVLHVPGMVGPELPRRRDRLDLAHWLTHPDNPLTARVVANRLWQHHFGRGLVATPNDFGLRGTLPTHPELLDWLATELIGQRWSLKHLHRLMVLSSTYQQDSRPLSELGRRTDPENRLLWRMNRQRLTGEALRDGVLAVAGTLNPRLGGPMVRVPLEPAVYDLIFTEGEPDGLWHVTPDPREHTRRSLYLFAKRNVRLPLLEALDQPDTLTSCPVRPVSTFAPQALILLNGPFMQEQSQAFAVRVLREAGKDRDRQIRYAYLLALARPPRPAEAETARTFLADQADLLRDRLRARLPVALPAVTPDGADPAAAAALADFCLALLNRNEFVYVP
jgi:hypothetical protein